MSRSDSSGTNRFGGELDSPPHIPAPGAAPTDDVLVQLLQRRAGLETEMEELKIRRQFLPPADYQKEFERIMVSLARVQRDIPRGDSSGGSL